MITVLRIGNRNSQRKKGKIANIPEAIEVLSPEGVETLAACVGEERDTLEDVYEPYLIQEGYLNRTAKGRMATALAFDHFGRKMVRPGAQAKLFE